MRSPSPRVRINRVDIYPNISGVDAGGGVAWTYPPTPTISQEPCTVQFRGTEEIVLAWDQSRVSQVNMFWIMFATQQGLSPRDKIIWVDTLDNPRTLFVMGDNTDEAGRGAAFVVKAVELL